MKFSSAVVVITLSQYPQASGEARRLRRNNALLEASTPKLNQHKLKLKETTSNVEWGRVVTQGLPRNDILNGRKKGSSNKSRSDPALRKFVSSDNVLPSRGNNNEMQDFLTTDAVEFNFSYSYVIPTSSPTATVFPSAMPSSQPSGSALPSGSPLSEPSPHPSDGPSESPITLPSASPSESPLSAPSAMPSSQPSGSAIPSSSPSSEPLSQPSVAASPMPSLQPGATPPSTCGSGCPVANGKFPTLDCLGWYRCDNNEAGAETACYGDTLFDENLGTCNWGPLVTCTCTSTASASEETSPTSSTPTLSPTPYTCGSGCPIGNKFYPTVDCLGYYYCNGNQAGAVIACPGGTLFDESAGYCNWAAQVTCTCTSTESESTSTTSSTPTSSPTPHTCGSGCPIADTNLPTVDCLGYYYCDGNQAGAVTNCSPGLLFDVDLQICNWAAAVTCTCTASNNIDQDVVFAVHK